MHQPWRELLEMDADVALLQEVGTVPEDVLDRVELSPHKPWLSHDPTTDYPHYDRWPMVVRLSDRVRVEWFRQIGPTGVTQELPGDWDHRGRPGDPCGWCGTIHRSFNVRPLVQPSSHRGLTSDLSPSSLGADIIADHLRPQWYTFPPPQWSVIRPPLML